VGGTPAELQSFVGSYLDEMREHLLAISEGAVAECAERLQRAYEAGAQVLVAGNGGSASTASHLACDLGKTVLGASPSSRASRFRVVSLADNVALLTAWANDAGYGTVFAEQVHMLGRPGDILLMISASGNSPNVVEAVRVAREVGLETIAFLGGDGGAVRDLVDHYVLVPCGDYGHVESAHLVLGHLLTDWLRQGIERHAVPESPARS
jgi:D-sedoheptulose 7-phosphate isomerase